MQRIENLFHGPLWRGNLHTHSNRSDGGRSPERLVSMYRQRGYDFMAITDHFWECFGSPVTDTRALRTEGFTTILGAEMHPLATATGSPWHLLALGLPLDFAPMQAEESMPSIVCRANAAGALVAVAHPAWYGLNDDEVLSVPDAFAIEAYNHTTRLLNDRGDSWGYVDRLLAQGRRYWALAVDDAHLSGSRRDCFGGWVYVQGRRLSPEDLLESLASGLFYCSQGPQITSLRWNRRRRLLEVGCTPVKEAFLSGYGWQASSVRAGRGTLTSFELSLEPFVSHNYARLTLVDGTGRRAWTNPFFF